MQVDSVIEGIVGAPFLAAVFGAWFILSVAAQFSPMKPTLVRRLDRFRLLPAWNFFAPKPGTSDYGIWYRDISAESFGQWRLLTETFATGGVSALWNRHMTGNKLLHDWVQILVEADWRIPYPELMEYTDSYRAILHAVLNASPKSSGALRQFAIVEKTGYPPKGSRVIFLSDGHQSDTE